jgi:Asp/Glu/hydantoin racemase
MVSCRRLLEVKLCLTFGSLLVNSLQDLVRHGPSSGITRRIVTLSQVAADAGAELIVFTCSSTSPAIDTARQTVSVPILKIDDPLYARVASAPGRVGLICTTSSTVAPSQALLTAHAQSAGREIPAESVLCAAAFEAPPTPTHARRQDLL